MQENIETIINEHYHLLNHYKNRINDLKNKPEVKEFLRMQESFEKLFVQTKFLEEQRDYELNKVSRK